MKKLITLITVALLAIIAEAQHMQQPEQHQTFKSIPITGTMEQFTAQLQSKGYQIVSSSNTIVQMRGRFAGYNNCDTYINSNSTINVVEGVGVSLPQATNWAQLLTTYNAMETMLTKKYGQPVDVIKEFVPFTPSEDADKFQAVKDNKCKYTSRYKNSTIGYITLTISNNSKGGSFVSIRYIDVRNSKLGQEVAIDDL